MGKRAQLLLHCTEAEAETVRRRAHDEYRGVSEYLLHLTMRTVELEERIARTLPSQVGLMGFRGRTNWRGTEPRTTMLLRCSADEARRIRRAAEVRQMTLSEYVFKTVRRAWQVTDAMAK
jgi:hypothetical protein